MAPPHPKSGLFVGLNEGHIVTRKELAPRPSARKGKTSKRVHFVKNLIREVAGFVPYEKMITELLKVGKDKRALKLAKRKLVTHKRAKKKREDVQCSPQDEGACVGISRSNYPELIVAIEMVRGATTLPHGTGKTIRIAVFAEGAAAEEAKAAGADVVGGDELIEEIRKGAT